MVTDLITVVRETEASLESRADQYYTQLELFSNRDEKVLSEFLKHERDDRPHYHRNKSWKLLVGKPKRYSRPKKYMKNQREQLPKVQKQIQDLLFDGKLFEMGVDHQTLSTFGGLPNMAYKMLNMETKLYESIVTYAKQLGQEKAIDPLKLVKNLENREEIYRRTFKTREQFEWYHRTTAEMGITTFATIYRIMEGLEPKIKQIETIPLFGWMGKKYIESKFRPIPPKVVAESFLKDEISYQKARALKIYPLQ